MRPCFAALLSLSLSLSPVVGACSKQHARLADAGSASELEQDGRAQADDPDERDVSPDEDGAAAEPDELEDDGEDAAPPPAQGARDAGLDAELCSVQKVELRDEAPEVLIVFDRSQSMTLEGRWEPSKLAIKALTREFEGVVAFGLETFPGEEAATTSDDILSTLLDGGGAMLCAGKIEIDLPIALHSAEPIGMALDARQTIGFTPTAEALRVAATYLGNRAPASGRKPGYVLLVTDGDPMCDLNASLNGTTGDPVEREASKAAVSALKQNHVATYVVGYQINAAHQPFMNELAMLGGTSRYRPVESADQMLAVLREISAGLIYCNFELRTQPLDPTHLHVQLDGIDVPRTADGWSLTGRTVTLGGSACETLRDGTPHRLELQLECEPTRGP
jgi:Mg-chelatase subunit ChlD